MKVENISTEFLIPSKTGKKKKKTAYHFRIP
jgi:hypothetical protein